MHKKESVQHSALIASASEQFDSTLKKLLPKEAFMSIDFRKSGNQARRCFLERYYDLIIINAPLSDETGLEMALDISEESNAAVLLAVPKEIYNDVIGRVVDYGIYVIAKPFSNDQLDRAVRYLLSVRNKLHKIEKELQKEKAKAEELRIVSKAKCILIERKNMTEDDAHRFIGKTAMDNGIPRGRAAQIIMDEIL